jgi:uncharacterized RDD family membrane protein YckC
VPQPANLLSPKEVNMIREKEFIEPGAMAAPTYYAGFWKRFAAILIDGIILGIVGGIVSAIFGVPSGGPVGTLFGWLYFATMESSSYQATLGKLILGIRVTDLQGQRTSFARATLRYFAKIISALILMIGFLMAAWTERKQALHDMIAGTLVVTVNGDRW